MTYQFKKNGEFDWQDDVLGLGNRGGMIAGFEYRIKPEPAAPKWPQTTMTEEQLLKWVGMVGNVPVRDVASAAIAHACESGALVPADKVREIEEKARSEGKREGMNPVHVIEAAWRHMKLGRLDPETIQIILLQAAK